MSFVRNRWYVAAWDGGIGAGGFSRTICSEPLVHERVNENMALRILSVDSGGAHSRRVIERLMKQDA